MNVEQATEVSNAAYESVFAVVEQLWMPHTHSCMPGCEIYLQLQKAG